MTTKKERSGIFFVVPAYNEGPVIAETVRPLVAAGYSVVVVDDGSSDDTAAQLANAGVHSVRHPQNLGQGAALQTGVQYALGEGAAYVAHFDADGQHSLESMEGLLDMLMSSDVDVVLGSRFLRREDREAVPLGRRLLLKGAVIVNGLLTGLWLSDAHNGARAMTCWAAEQIELKENGFAHATEILQQIHAKGLRYVEGPTRIHYTEYSTFKGQKATGAINILIDLILRRLLK